MARERRRVPVDRDGTGGGPRAGCLALGAILGILAGIMVALYALPPILNAIYGEKVIKPGDTGEAGGHSFAVRSFAAGPDLLCEGLPGCPAASLQIRLAVTAGDAWTPVAEDFSVEFRRFRTWIEAMEPLPGRSETALAWDAGEKRTAVLRFPLPLGALPDDVEPVAVHIRDPRLRLELDGSIR